MLGLSSYGKLTFLARVARFTAIRAPSRWQDAMVFRIAVKDASHFVASGLRNRSGLRARSAPHLARRRHRRVFNAGSNKISAEVVMRAPPRRRGHKAPPSTAVCHCAPPSVSVAHATEPVKTGTHECCQAQLFATAHRRGLLRRMLPSPSRQAQLFRVRASKGERAEHGPKVRPTMS
jgi:hypothetical protein